ncbi:hypothetical protein PG991_009582 [Apiospora marii]|uniref:Uncharacterized protein n=1 Tax=Apiospora marii TaxID=335849 RepID=A0ABR1RKF3_9PEZI
MGGSPSKRNWVSRTSLAGETAIHGVASEVASQAGDEKKKEGKGVFIWAKKAIDPIEGSSWSRVALCARHSPKEGRDWSKVGIGARMIQGRPGVGLSASSIACRPTRPARWWRRGQNGRIKHDPTCTAAAIRKGQAQHVLGAMRPPTLSNRFPSTGPGHVKCPSVITSSDADILTSTPMQAARYQKRSSSLPGKPTELTEVSRVVDGQRPPKPGWHPPRATPCFPNPPAQGRSGVTLMESSSNATFAQIVPYASHM